MEAKKTCPLCGEEILAVAIKCKHCGSMLDGTQAPTQAAAAAAIAKPATDLKLFLLAVPVLAIVLMWFWIPSIPMIQGPASSLQLVVVGTVVLTAILAAFEAHSSGVQGNRSEGTYSPVGWFFLFVLLWVVSYPYYLAKRKKYGLGSLLGVGILITLLFVGSAYVMGAAISEQQDKIRATLDQIGQ